MTCKPTWSYCVQYRSKIFFYPIPRILCLSNISRAIGNPGLRRVKVCGTCLEQESSRCERGSGDHDPKMLGVPRVYADSLVDQGVEQGMPTFFFFFFLMVK